MLACFTSDIKNATPIILVAQQNFSTWLKDQGDLTKTWLTANQFKADPGSVALIPDVNGNIAQVVVCISDTRDRWCVAHLAFTLPQGKYKFIVNESDYYFFALAFGLGAYQFSRYKAASREAAQLYIPETVAPVQNIVESIYEVRDLINTPTDDMGPSEFSLVAEKLAKKYSAQFTEVKGQELLTQNYPCIYTVGRASDDPPRLLDLRWGNAAHPKVTLVGKGVCFDSGGLDIKPSSAMLLMKKDMAGGAHVLGLARMLMQAMLPICLRVLIPVVENVISGNAYRPGDIIKSRKGITIEIGNTDAEGRVILADALTEAASEQPELLIDIATLTGAARIALGTELPVVFSNNDALVAEVIQHGEKQGDPMWRLPLYAPYREYINSPIADINNNSTESYAGAITAGLFLKEFVPDDLPWLHFDLMAWNLRSRPGRPQGGEAMVLRALFSYLESTFV